MGPDPRPMVVEVHEETVNDSRGNPRGIIGELYRDGEVQFKINTVDTGVRGTALFLRMMAAFGSRVTAIRGFWPSVTNLNAVNDLIGRGLSLEDAVTKTWTARRAASLGFKRVERIVAVPGDPVGPAYRSIEVRFVR